MPAKVPGWKSSRACLSEVPTPICCTPGWEVTVWWALTGGCVVEPADWGGGDTHRYGCGAAKPS